MGQQSAVGLVPVILVLVGVALVELKVAGLLVGVVYHGGGTSNMERAHIIYMRVMCIEVYSIFFSVNLEA